MIRTGKSKKRFSLWLSVIHLTFLVFFILSCGQDSIFFDISNEPEPKTPLISGTPTSMALVRNMLFVGSRMSNRIFQYGSAGGNIQWSSVPSPRGPVSDLATDGEHLYALVFPGGDPLTSSVIQRFHIDTNTWNAEFTMSEYSIQTLFGVEGKVFAGAALRSDLQNYAILHIDRSTFSMEIVKSNTSLLTGVASDAAGNIYLATAGRGIYIFSNDAVATSPVEGTEQANITGIIGTVGSVVAVSSNGNIYYLRSPGVFTSYPGGFIFTGAMSLWVDRENGWAPSLLLVGIRSRGMSTVHGYREMVLDRDGFPTLPITIPGDGSPTSVRNRARYTASIGQYPVEAILQIPDISRGGPLDYSAFTSDPDWEPPIFASTSRNGLWSYRNGTWNAEE
jgi:hypothetical protein